MARFALILLGFQFLFTQAVEFPAGWEELHDSTGWSLVYQTEQVTGYNKNLSVSPVPAIRYVLETRANPVVLLNLIWDVEHYPQILPGAHITAAGFIERDENRQLAWQVMDVPLLSPRLYQYEHFRQTQRIGWVPTGTPLPMPGYEKLIVPLVNFGSWEIESDARTTRLIYRICTDPGGFVPVWLVKWANRRLVPQMLRELEAAALGSGN